MSAENVVFPDEIVGLVIVGAVRVLPVSVHDWLIPQRLDVAFAR